jgi:LemA protein
MGSLIFLGVIVVVGFIFMMLYNKLVALRQNRRQAFSDIDVQLKQRFDLIPQLIETVKGYVTHEKEVLQTLTAARTNVAGVGNSISERVTAENQLTRALGGLFAVAENYPDLKANQTFQRLMDELSVIEDKIAAARRFFNSATADLNTAIEQFPSSLIAGPFGFKQEPFFEVDETTKAAMQEPVKVKFG